MLRKFMRIAALFAVLSLIFISCGESPEKERPDGPEFFPDKIFVENPEPTLFFTSTTGTYISINPDNSISVDNPSGSPGYGFWYALPSNWADFEEIVIHYEVEVFEETGGVKFGIKPGRAATADPSLYKNVAPEWQTQTEKGQLFEDAAPLIGSWTIKTSWFPQERMNPPAISFQVNNYNFSGKMKFKIKVHAITDGDTEYIIKPPATDCDCGCTKDGCEKCDCIIGECDTACKELCDECGKCPCYCQCDRPALEGSITIQINGIDVDGDIETYTVMSAVFTPAGSDPLVGDVKFQWERNGDRIHADGGVSTGGVFGAVGKAGVDGTTFTPYLAGEYTVIVVTDNYKDLLSDPADVINSVFEGELTITPAGPVIVNQQLTVVYTGTELTDKEVPGTNIAYSWFRGTEQVTANSLTQTPNQIGNYSVKLTVKGFNEKISNIVEVTPPPAVNVPITLDAAPATIGVFANRGTITAVSNGYRFVADESAGWGNPYAWFTIDFGAGGKLSDYEKITFDLKGISGDIRYKNWGLLARTADFSGSQGNGTAISVTTPDGGQLGPQVDFSEANTTKSVSLTIDMTKAAAYNTNQSLRMSIYTGLAGQTTSNNLGAAGAPTTFEVANIVFTKGIPDCACGCFKKGCKQCDCISGSCCTECTGGACACVHEVTVPNPVFSGWGGSGSQGDYHVFKFDTSQGMNCRTTYTFPLAAANYSNFEIKYTLTRSDGSNFGPNDSAKPMKVTINDRSKDQWDNDTLPAPTFNQYNESTSATTVQQTFSRAITARNQLTFEHNTNNSESTSFQLTIDSIRFFNQ